MCIVSGLSWKTFKVGLRFSWEHDFKYFLHSRVDTLQNTRKLLHLKCNKKCKCEGKVIPVLSLSTTPWRHIGEWRYSSMHSLTSTLDGGDWSAPRLDRFTPRERAPSTHWIGGWVSPKAVLDTVVKRKIPSPSRESNPRTPIVQSLAQRYTDWAITALKFNKKFNTFISYRHQIENVSILLCLTTSS
jgi:hypothetical protein